MPKSKSKVNLNNAREEEQRKVMEGFQEDGKCPFCLEQILKLENQPVLFQNEDWSVIENRWPYKHTRIHLLFISKRHVERLMDLSPNEFASLLSAAQWAEREYKVASGAVVMRFGDSEHNGASVIHLHVHFIVGDGSGKCYAKVGQ
jgi:ATP adenylyltransferase